MFDFLKKPTHHHPPISQSQQKQDKLIQEIVRNESIKISIVPTELKSSKKRIAKILQVPKIKSAQKKKNFSLIDPQTKHIFNELLVDSQKIFNDDLISQTIKACQASIQKGVYTCQTSTSAPSYLNQLFKNVSFPNELLSKNLRLLTYDTISAISQDIQHSQNNYSVFKKNASISQGQTEVNHIETLIKNNQDQIQRKVGELKIQLNIQDQKIIHKRAMDIVNHNNNKQKQKQIQQFIQNKRQAKQQIHRKKAEAQQKIQLKKLQQKVKEQQQKEKAKSERHKKLVQKLEAKKILKQAQQQQRQQQGKKFSLFLQKYRSTKPLYQKKLQQQISKQIQQRRQRYHQLSVHKSSYHPLSLEELETFQQKYLQLKQHHKQVKQAEDQLRRDAERIRNQQMKKQHYKGKYTYIVLEDMLNNKLQKQQIQSLKQKRLQNKRAYSVDVKQKFKPHIDQSKRLESLKFMAKSQRKRKQKGPRRVRIQSANHSNYNDYNTISYNDNYIQQVTQPDAKQQGKKNMKLFKQYIHQKILKGQIKKKEQNNQKIATPKPNYLKELRQNRPQSLTLQAQSLISRIKKQSKGDISLFKLKSDQLDQKTRRQQLRLKYSQHSVYDQKQLQQDYLTSIKAKLQLLSSCK